MSSRLSDTKVWLLEGFTPQPSLIGLPPGNLDLSAPGGQLQGLSGVYIVEVYSFLQLGNFVSFDKVFSTNLIEIDNIYNNIRENLLSNAISVELEEVDG